MRGADNRLNSLHGLKDRVRQLVDPHYAADKKLKERFKGEGAKSDRPRCDWGTVPLDDPVYLEYSGLDPVITVRLLETLWFLGGSPLVSREHELMVECMLMTWRGMKIDRGYRTKLAHSMLMDAEIAHLDAKELGFPADTISLKDDKLAVTAWLEAGGVDVPKTGKGAPSLAKDGLYLALDGSPLEPAVKNFFKSKELTKLVNDYLSKMDVDRCHPDIRSIGAVTGRQSVGNPPFHQLPASVRGCIVPDAGMVLGAVDLDRIEFCVAAGLAQDTAMTEAIKEGIDLHARTAAMVHGGKWQDWLDSPERGLAKGAGFGRMFGGGAATLARQSGVSEETMDRFIKGFDRAYPDVRKLGRRLGSQDWVINPWGRRIPADPIRRYGNLNYAIQSTAREIFVDWMLEVIKAGIQVLLPLHDELVFQAESGEAMETVVSLLRKDFMGVPLTAGGKLMDRWTK